MFHDPHILTAEPADRDIADPLPQVAILHKGLVVEITDTPEAWLIMNTGSADPDKALGYTFRTSVTMVRAWRAFLDLSLEPDNSLNGYLVSSIVAVRAAADGRHPYTGFRKGNLAEMAQLRLALNHILSGLPLLDGDLILLIMPLGRWVDSIATEYDIDLW